MKYILCGDDSVVSRKCLSELIAGFQVAMLDGKNLTVAQLEENLASTSLFDEKKAVVVESLFSKNKKKKEIVTFLNTFKSDILLIFWEDRKLLKTSYAGFKDVVVREFVLPQQYFQFLDTFAPGQAKRVYLLYQALLSSYAPEQLFYALLKRVRLLLVLSENGMIPEVAKLSQWQKTRLDQQKKMWSQSKLRELYFELGQAEINMKSGRLPVSLSKHLDILILSRLA
jgi:DNA polymerase III delta subunit